LANRAPNPQQRPPRGGTFKFRGTIQQSDDLPLASAILAGAGTSVEVARADHVHPWGAFSLPHGIIGWCLPSTPAATQLNPTPLCWAFAIKIFVPVPFPLRGYGFALESAGLVSHGVIRTAVWTHDYANNRPLARYSDTRIDIRVAGMAAGWHQFPLPSWGGVLRTLSSGTSWIVATIQCDPGRSIIVPPLEWLNGGHATNGNCYGIEVGTIPGFIAEPWDSASAVPQTTYAPSLFIV
jgi:hypothetical protein